MIEKTLDVTELPVAGTVKDGDQLLLVRTQKDGAKVPMRMKAPKVKKQQIVIGRAIRPKACEIGGVENWYVFGSASYFSNLLLLNIAPMSDNVFDDIGYDMVILKIKDQKNGDIFVFKQEVTMYDKLQLYVTFWANNSTVQTSNVVHWSNIFCNEQNFANAFRVDSYDLTGRVLTLNLTHKILPTADLRGTSKHHYFKDGVRKWHVSKQQIACNAFAFISPMWAEYGGLITFIQKSFGTVLPTEDILVKKEIRLLPRLKSQYELNLPRRSNGIVESYSKVLPIDGKEICYINGPYKRRPFGKYKIWTIHRWCRRKSDEYLHCRMKCVGLGNIKDVIKGPRFDKYRVTVREI